MMLLYPRRLSRARWAGGQSFRIGYKVRKATQGVVMDKNNNNNQSREESKTSIGLNDFKEFMHEYELERVHTEFMSKVVTLSLASLGLITALAWDDTLRALLHEIYDETPTLGERALYALAITFLAVALSIIIGKLLSKSKLKK